MTIGLVQRDLFYAYENWLFVGNRGWRSGNRFAPKLLPYLAAVGFWPLPVATCRYFVALVWAWIALRLGQLMTASLGLCLIYDHRCAVFRCVGRSRSLIGPRFLWSLTGCPRN